MCQELRTQRVKIRNWEFKKSERRQKQNDSDEK